MCGGKTLFSSAAILWRVSTATDDERRIKSRVDVPFCAGVASTSCFFFEYKKQMGLGVYDEGRFLLSLYVCVSILSRFHVRSFRRDRGTGGGLQSV